MTLQTVLLVWRFWLLVAGEKEGVQSGGWFLAGQGWMGWMGLRSWRWWMAYNSFCVSTMTCFERRSRVLSPNGGSAFSVGIRNNYCLCAKLSIRLARSTNPSVSFCSSGRPYSILHVWVTYQPLTPPQTTWQTRLTLVLSRFLITFILCIYIWYVCVYTCIG